MEELIKYIVQNLVEDKEAVTVTSREEEKAVVVEVAVAEQDTGKVIGKNGKVAQAIRSILHSAAHKETKKYILKIK
ncbi:MAG: KH domain-containing protein [Clostridia bacterium]|nr:KH domain-containing protein [Clostridia bacterium]